MGKKYIIEKDDNESIWSIYADANGDATIEGVSLTPYAEPDLEQVRKEAYEDGYKTAKVQCNIQAEKDLREVGERHYQKGLSDAWEAARKVTQVRKYGGYGDCLGDVFGRTDTSWDVFDYSASEAIEKIRQYERGKEEQIQVGDEVNAPFGKAIIVNVDSVAEKIWFLYADGLVGFDFFKNAPTKTGRHFPEIVEVLQNMKEEA